MSGSPRKLNAFDATMIVMGGILGIGIFFRPYAVALLVPEPTAFLALWLVGGLLALCGAYTFAELGASFPRAGGWFVYLKETWGPFCAYLFAWIVLFVVSTGAIAVVADFCAQHLGALLPFLAAPGGGMQTDPAVQTGTAIAIIVLLTGITLCGIKVGATFQNALMLVKLGATAVLVVAGLALFVPEAAGEAAAVAAAPLAAPEGALASRMLQAMLPVLFAYGGWQMLGYTATEVKDPTRTLPRAIVLGVGGVVVCYVLLNGAYLRVLGIEGIAAGGDFVTRMAERVLGTGGERFVGAALAVSSLGVCAVFVIGTPWLYVAMAREGLFFRPFARLHATTGAPTWGLSLQAGIAITYLVVAGTDVIERVSDAIVFAEWIFHALVAVGLVRLRRARPDVPQPFRSPLFPLLPCIYFVLATAIVVGNVVESPIGTTGLGLGVLAVGALVYVPWRRAFTG